MSDSWIKEADSLFALLDEEEKGSIDSDRIQFFLMALLLNEINDTNKKEMPELIRKQTKAIMEHMGSTNGIVTLRNFKSYLLIQRLRRESEVQALKSNLTTILSAW